MKAKALEAAAQRACDGWIAVKLQMAARVLEDQARHLRDLGMNNVPRFTVSSRDSIIRGNRLAEGPKRFAVDVERYDLEDAAAFLRWLAADMASAKPAETGVSA